jgi:predicted CXXCH cytochrome family protein
MKKLMTKTLVCSAAAAGLFLAAQAADAAISGACVTCHTMHNSQGGTAMTSGGTAAQDYLLISQGTCVGCHTGAAGSLRNSFGAPTVVHTGAPSTYPAGGSFYWVDDGGAGQDTKGHNVVGVNDPDGTLGNVPPGGTAAAALQCQGCHVGGGHHTNTTGTWVSGSSNGANSYRFLTRNVAGYEDTNWEWTKSNSDHNVYKAGTDTSGANGISNFCAACHGNFHGSANIGGTASPWKRHPTDIDLPSTGEYAAYNTYDVTVPVGYSTATAPQAAVEAGENSVVCVSCHRVHGSPYDDLLRWSYTMTAGSSGTTGCFVCHTTK